jgi:hypothetical protein
MQTSIALGNGKSELLLQTEKQVWRLLFNMAKGSCDLDNLLRELVEYGTPWDALTAAPESERQWFFLSTTTSQVAASSLHQNASSSSLPLPQQSTSPTPSSAPQAPMTQEGAHPGMDWSPDFEDPVQPSTQPTAPTPVPEDGGEQPMDTRLDVEDALMVNGGAVPEPEPEPDYGDERSISLGDDEDPPYDFDHNMGDAGEQNEDQRGQYSEEGCTGGQQDAGGDEEGDNGVDERGQQNKHPEILPTVGSQPNAPVQPSRTSARLGDKKTERPSIPPPLKAPKKRQGRPGTKCDKNSMSDPEGTPDLERLDESAVRRLLAAGDSYRTPIDVEALDMLMRNFPITEEHQVRFAGVDSSRRHINHYLREQVFKKEISLSGAGKHVRGLCSLKYFCQNTKNIYSARKCAARKKFKYLDVRRRTACVLVLWPMYVTAPCLCFKRS